MLDKIKKFLLDTRFQIIFKFLAIILVFFILLDRLSYNEIKNSLNFNSNFIFILILIFLIRTTATFFAFIRWYNLLKSNKENKLSYRNLISPLLYSETTVQFGFIGQLISRTVLTKKNLKLNSIISSTIIEKFLSALMLLFISFVTLTLYFYFFSILYGSFLYYIYFIVLFILIFTILFFYFFNKYSNYLESKISDITIIKYFVNYLSIRKISLSFVYSLVIQILGLMTLFFTAMIFEYNLPIFQFFLLMPIALLISNIPITFSQFGWRELVFIYVFNILTLTDEKIFLIGISLGIMGGITAITHVLLYELFLFFYYQISKIKKIIT